MNVRTLIKELQALPKNLEVSVAMHDNSEYEIAGDVCNVIHFIKSDYDPDNLDVYSREMFEDMPNDCIILRC